MQNENDARPFLIPCMINYVKKLNPNFRARDTCTSCKFPFSEMIQKRKEIGYGNNLL